MPESRTRTPLAIITLTTDFDAVSGFWTDIGIETQVLRVSYGLVKPTFVGRSNSIPAIMTCESDPQKRLDINEELADYMHFWMVGSGVTSGPFLNVYNSNAIELWGLRTSPHNPVNSFELLVPAR